MYYDTYSLGPKKVKGIILNPAGARRREVNLMIIELLWITFLDHCQNFLQRLFIFRVLHKEFAITIGPYAYNKNMKEKLPIQKTGLDRIQNPWLPAHLNVICLT